MNLIDVIKSGVKNKNKKTRASLRVTMEHSVQMLRVCIQFYPFFLQKMMQKQLRLMQNKR